MNEIMKKTHKDSIFVKAQLSIFPKQTLGKEDEIVLQLMVLNEKEVLLEVVPKDKYGSSVML